MSSIIHIKHTFAPTYVIAARAIVHLLEYIRIGLYLYAYTHADCVSASEFMSVLSVSTLSSSPSLPLPLSLSNCTEHLTAVRFAIVFHAYI